MHNAERVAFDAKAPEAELRNALSLEPAKAAEPK
jgi:hypothetical protein